MENENFSTPRTDAMVTAFPYTLGSTALIPTSFARQLEGELATASAALARSEERVKEMTKAIRAFIDSDDNVEVAKNRFESAVYRGTLKAEDAARDELVKRRDEREAQLLLLTQSIEQP